MESEAWFNGNLVYPTSNREAWANGDLVFPTETGVTPTTAFIPRVIWFMLLALMFCLSGCVSLETPFGDFGATNGSEVTVRAAANQTVVVKIGVKENECIQEDFADDCETCPCPVE